MLRDRYRDDDIPGGLLYYMKTDHMTGLSAESHDIRSEREREGGREGGREGEGEGEGGRERGREGERDREGEK